MYLGVFTPIVTVYIQSDSGVGMFENITINGNNENGQNETFVVDQQLAARGISQKTVSTFQIRLDKRGAGWLYPVPNGNGAMRWKNISSKAPKYCWPTGKPEGANYYHAPNLAEVVKSNYGHCWLVSGEADVWAMYSAGIENVVSCGYSETTIPDGLVEFLTQLGVSTLHIAPDLDETGERWASEISSRLRGSNIVLDAICLPAELGAKGDLGRAWTESNRTNWPFERWLLSLPKKKLKTPISKKKTKPRVIFENSNSDVLFQTRLLIADALGVWGFRPDGYSENLVHCPFHSDENPSASLHSEIGLHCFAEGEWYTWEKLIKKLKATGALEKATLNNQVDKLSELGLTTDIRECLLQQRATTAARILDILYLSGVKPGDIVTAQQVWEKCKPYDISLNTVYRVLNKYSHSGNGMGLEIFAIFSPFYSFQHVIREDHAKKYRRGRREIKYRIPTLEELENKLAVAQKIRHYDPISSRALRENKLYRAEVHAAMPKRRPGNYSRRFLGERIGVSSKTTRNYDKMVNLEIVYRLKRRVMTLGDILTLPSDEELAHKPSKNFCRWLETESGRRYKPTRDGARRALATNETVYIVKQLVSHYGAQRDCNNSALHWDLFDTEWELIVMSPDEYLEKYFSRKKKGKMKK